MAAGWKLRNMAKERGTTERALLIWALDTSANYGEAALKLGITRNGVRKAVARYNITIARRTVIVS